jgi:hypothetical protein
MSSWRVGGFGALGVLMVAGGASAALAQDHDDARWRDHCEEQSRWGSRARYCEVRIQHLDARVGRLTVDGRENGAIEIAASNGDSIVVHERVEAQAASPDEARELAGQIQVIASDNSIHAEGPSHFHRDSWAVSYRIFVPKRLDLTLTTTNGPLEIDGVTGRMQLRAVNGPIELSQVGGDIHARAENGPLQVELTGSRWDGAGLDAETTNGPVELRVPAQYAAHLETGTVNGPMEVDFPVTVQGRFDPHRIAIDLGGGGSPVRVVTTNGPVVVRKD